MGIGKTWTDEEKVEDFVVAIMVFGIVLTMGKIDVSGFELL